MQRNRFCQIAKGRVLERLLVGHGCYVPADVSSRSMRDAVTGLIGRYDLQGRHFDSDAIASVERYYSQASTRLKAVEVINREAAEIVHEASQRLFAEDPELLLPGGNAYTTRRLAACLRDMDYFLRYGSYALMAGDPTILDERVLNGLDDTYKSLGVPTGPVIRAIVLLANVICEQLLDQGIVAEHLAIVRQPFDHMAAGLAPIDLRAR